MILLGLLFLSSLGEVYFPDIMKLNRMPSRTNWFFIAHALGNTAVILLPTEGQQLLGADWRAASVPALLDIASYSQLFAGVALAGAQTKSILYSSSIFWSAVLSRVLLGKTLSTAQWLSIALLFAGLVLKSSAGLGSSVGGASSSFMMGAGLILFGCLTHAFVNVRNEALISSGRISAKILCVVIGIYAMAMWTALYAAGFIIPELQGQQWVWTREHFTWSSLWVQDASGGVPMRSGLAWLGFVLSTAVHAGAFFSLLGSVGTVSSGIVKGMTTSAYVLLSGLVFCSVDGSYCLNWRTLASAGVCVTSVLCYSVATSLARARSAKDAKLAVDADQVPEPVGSKDSPKTAARRRLFATPEVMGG